MSGEMIAIVAVGVALAGVILTSLRGTEARLGAQIKDLRGEVGELRERMAHEISELRERMAKLEGLLEGLREAITGRIAAQPVRGGGVKRTLMKLVTLLVANWWRAHCPLSLNPTKPRRAFTSCRISPTAVGGNLSCWSRTLRSQRAAVPSTCTVFR